MKMTPEHLAIVRAAVAPLDTKERRAQYIAEQFPRASVCRDHNMRYRWDLLFESGLKIGDGVGMSGLPLYSYLNDDHIDTALRTLVKPLEK